VQNVDWDELVLLWRDDLDAEDQPIKVTSFYAPLPACSN